MWVSLYFASWKALISGEAVIALFYKVKKNKTKKITVQKSQAGIMFINTFS